MINLNTDTEYSKSPTLWVVLSADKSTVLVDPGLGNKPFSTTNKKRAEQVAKESGGFAVPYKEAMDAVLKHPKNQPPKK